MAFSASYQTAGPNSGYVPQFDKQANLVVNYSRNWKKNKVNELWTLTPVKLEIGKYPKINPKTKINVTDTYLQSRKWSDGQLRPVHQLGHTQIEWFEYFCQRYDETEVLGYKTKAQTVFDIEQVMIDQLADRTMVSRALQFYTELQDADNYLSSGTGTATATGGGKWDAATSTSRYIQKSLAAASQAILKNTGGSVKASDLVLVVGPSVAHKMAASAEIADYLAQNPVAPQYLQGDLFKDQLAMYGLPPYLYGIKVIVDENVRETAPLGGTSSVSFMTGETSAYLIARQGGLVGMAGGGNFSFIHCFTYTEEEMLVETLDDPMNKRFILAVVDTRDVKVVAQEAAFLFTAVVD